MLVSIKNTIINIDNVVKIDFSKNILTIFYITGEADEFEGPDTETLYNFILRKCSFSANI